MREVEAEAVGPHGGAGLLDVLAEVVAQRALQQVRAGVVRDVARRRAASTRACTMSPGAQLAVQPHEQRLVAVEAVDRLDLAAHGVRADLARVRDLAAALGVERRVRELDEREAFGEGLDGEHLASRPRARRSPRTRCGGAERAKRAMRSSSTRSPRRAAARARSRCACMWLSKPSRSMPRPASRASSAVSSTGKPCVSCSSKTSPACRVDSPCVARPRDQVVEQARAGRERLREALLLGLEQAAHVVAVLGELGEAVGQRLDHGLVHARRGTASRGRGGVPCSTARRMIRRST